MSKLTGKVAVVTGASKGIGAAIAKSLAAEGAFVVVNYASSKAGADTVVAAITAAGGKAVAVGGDVSKAAEANGIIDAAIKNYGRLDILVNNSGVYEFTPIEAITEEQFHKHLMLMCSVFFSPRRQPSSTSVKAPASSTSAPLPVASHLRTARFTPAPRARLTPSLACSPESSAPRRSGSTLSIPAWSRLKAPTAAASSDLISRRPLSRRLHSAASANLATSPPSLCFWRRKTPPGSRASNFSPPVAFANP
jgi:NAD(P)-dependent dehydrogenase (short-subunit alcohol dehydrogenase family)